VGRKNKRIPVEVYLPPIKEAEDRRSMPTCKKFPHKTVFTTGWRAQEAIDEIKARSNRSHTPERVYDCKLSEGGCGYFHTTSMREYKKD